MKKISDKLQILGLLIVGIVISSIIATKAATTLSSTSVYYDASKSGGSSSNVNGAIDELYSLTTDREKLKQDIVNIIYPVGSIYMSTEDDTVEKVQDKFGGTWVRYAEDTTLVGYKNDTNEVNETGGSKNVTLDITNIPEHIHTIPELSGTTSSVGNHYHNLGGTSGGAHAFSWGSGVGTVHSEISVLPGATGAGTNYLYTIQNSWNSTSYNGAHNHSVTTTASNTTTCTNCSGTSFSVQNPYVVVYMYQRTA